MAKMNSTNLYVTTTQIILKCDPNNPATWQDLYRLVPYLRNSLTCVVCGNLLVEPMTPTGHKCQHHLCKKCRGGRKRIKPACTWCKECDNYSENKQLRTLLQCYKKMCSTLLNSGIYRCLEQTSRSHPLLGVECGSSNLMYLIAEGASFQDEYRSNVGLTKAEINILPCIYTNSSTQTLQVASADSAKTVFNANPSTRTPLYSVLYTGSGSKITIKRKAKDAHDKIAKTNIISKRDIGEKKPPMKCVVKQRRGCRCGNATPTPGKLTCCGQRCPCYVESKACLDCKCRGCRNPHTPDGNKVINLPHILKQFQQVTNQVQPQPVQTYIQQRQIYQMPQPKQDLPMIQTVKIELDANLTLEQLNEHLQMNVLDTYTEVPTTLPHAFLMNDVDIKKEDEDIMVDV
ncbi:putative zinc ion binding protein [Trypoxylus dichotomus]